MESRVTPHGELMWAKLITPGVSNKGQADEKVQWSVDLLLAKSDAEAQEFVQSLKRVFQDAFGATARPGSKGLPWKTFLDDKGDETDLWQFTFRRNTVTKRGNDLPPPVVQDARGNAWRPDLLIGNGSTGKVAFSPWTWDSPSGGKGVSLNLDGVRILHLVEYSPPSAAAAFGEPEQGFVLPPKDDLFGEPEQSPKQSPKQPHYEDPEDLPW